jgi:hypothetical protein
VNFPEEDMAQCKTETETHVSGTETRSTSFFKPRSSLLIDELKDTSQTDTAQGAQSLCGTRTETTLIPIRSSIDKQNLKAMDLDIDPKTGVVTMAGLPRFGANDNVARIEVFPMEKNGIVVAFVGKPRADGSFPVFYADFGTASPGSYGKREETLKRGEDPIKKFRAHMSELDAANSTSKSEEGAKAATFRADLEKIEGQFKSKGYSISEETTPFGTNYRVIRDGSGKQVGKLFKFSDDPRYSPSEGLEREWRELETLRQRLLKN